jgi:hypothetical protein
MEDPKDMTVASQRDYYRSQLELVNKAKEGEMSVLYQRLVDERERVKKLERRVELLTERVHMLTEDNKNVLKQVDRWKEKAVSLMVIVKMMTPANSGHADCKCSICSMHNEIKRIMEE